MKIVIIDYGVGNVQSIVNAMGQFKNVDISLSSDAKEILDADGIILPGVGAFKNAMKELERRFLPKVLNNFLLKNKPILGICLGMQLLFESSNEFGFTKGLGFIGGRVEGFPKNINDKLPHVGWSKAIESSVLSDRFVFRDIKDEDYFYFVHSFICKPKNPHIVSTTTEYGGIDFCSSIEYNNIFACQYHPEKSSKSGLKILKNFIKKVEVS